MEDMPMAVRAMQATTMAATTLDKSDEVTLRMVKIMSVSARG